MINRVILVGRLTRDPELRKTTSGTAVASFTVAVDNKVKDANGERTTSFVPCTVWNQQAENVSKFMHKGSLVGVDGRLNQRTYEAKDGRKVFVIEVIAESVQFLERKEDSNNPKSSLEKYQAPEEKMDSTEEINPEDFPF